MRVSVFVIAAVCAGAAACSGESGMIADAEAAVRSQLRDPESARFSAVRVERRTGSGPNQRTVCGLVNARNGFGGYVGDVRFYYTAAEGAFIEEEPPSPEFDQTYSTLCR